jgi:hypothetical protein
MKSFIILMVLLAAVFAFGQTGCDINGNGFPDEVGDLVILATIMSGSPDFYRVCEIDCDIDEDGMAMTIADITLFYLYLSNPSAEPPQLTYTPDADTAMIGSAETSPGSQVSLPVWLNITDSLVSYEFLIRTEAEILTIDSFEPDTGLDLLFTFSPDFLHIYDVGRRFIVDSTFIPPGNYHLGNLIVNVNPDIIEPVTTNITFGTCPDDNFYTGLANMTFFVPVLVEGVVTITPVGVEESEPSLPIITSIEAYPNPFNISVKIVVESPVRDVLSIYDILGREIYSIEVDAGINFITWNSLDYDNDQVNAGIYFAKLRRSSSDVKKLLLMK